MNHLIPPGAREVFVTLPEGRVRVLVGGSGEGTPAVLIHGGGGDNAGISWFRSFVPFGVDRTVMAVDLPGFGGSRDAPALGGPDAMADFVVRVAAELGITRAVVFGVSMGGDVAMNVALRHPGFVAGLVLIAPGGLAERVGGPVTHYFTWLATLMPDWLLVPFARFSNLFAKQVLQAIVVDPAKLPDEVVAEFVRESRSPGGGMAYGRYNQATVGRTRLVNNLMPRVHEIAVPTLFFHGDRDRLVSIDDSREASGLITGAKLVVAPNTGHWAQLEVHDLFVNSAREFLMTVPDEGR